MPFTVSHAVVALPFVRSPLIPAAIAIGAMTPDLPLFLRRVGLSYAMTHDLTWIAATMGVALVLLLVWRCLLRPVTRELSPSWLATRLPASWDGGMRAALRETFPSAVGVLLLAVSLALGVVSHIAWDLFTHEGRGGVQLLPVLDEQWGPFVGFKWLQYASSAFGLIALAVWALLWLRRQQRTDFTPVLPAGVRTAWWISLPMLLLGAAIWGYVTTGPFTSEWTPTHLAYLVLPPACAIWGAAALLLAAVALLARASSARTTP